MLRSGGVGIYGASYGGFMTLMAMAQEPDLFSVGVAIAPVTDWAGYDTAYTERYLGTPDRQPGGVSALLGPRPRRRTCAAACC